MNVFVVFSVGVYVRASSVDNIKLSRHKIRIEKIYIYILHH